MGKKEQYIGFNMVVVLLLVYLGNIITFIIMMQDRLEEVDCKHGYHYIILANRIRAIQLEVMEMKRKLEGGSFGIQ